MLKKEEEKEVRTVLDASFGMRNFVVCFAVLGTREESLLLRKNHRCRDKQESYRCW